MSAVQRPETQKNPHASRSRHREMFEQSRAEMKMEDHPSERDVAVAIYMNSRGAIGNALLKMPVVTWPDTTKSANIKWEPASNINTTIDLKVYRFSKIRAYHPEYGRVSATICNRMVIIANGEREPVSDRDMLEMEEALQKLGRI